MWLNFQSQGNEAFSSCGKRRGDKIISHASVSLSNWKILRFPLRVLITNIIRRNRKVYWFLNSISSENFVKICHARQIWSLQWNVKKKIFGKCLRNSISRHCEIKRHENNIQEQQKDEDSKHDHLELFQSNWTTVKLSLSFCSKAQYSRLYHSTKLKRNTRL